MQNTKQQPKSGRKVLKLIGISSRLATRGSQPFSRLRFKLCNSIFSKLAQYQSSANFRAGSQ